MIEQERLLPVEVRGFRFSLSIIKFLKSHRTREDCDRIIIRQLIRSATSIGANLAEAQGAPSKADFRNKNSIALKESRETIYWLRLLIELTPNHSDEIGRLLEEACQINKIIGAIIFRLKKSLP